MGMCYAQTELFVRGETYLPMTFIGGTACILIGLLDKHPAAIGLKMWQFCILGMLIVTDVELLSGYLFNEILGMGLWDYSKNPFNVDGQICLRMTVLWFFLTPVAMWLNNFLSWKLFDEKEPLPVWNNYQRLFTFN